MEYREGSGGAKCIIQWTPPGGTGRDYLPFIHAGFLTDFGASPIDYLPLGLCQGDCDIDSDCEGSLHCYQRNDGDPTPPGCTGEGTNDFDYCFMPVPLKNLGNPTADNYLGLCEGDCDKDSHCKGSLRCHQRHGSDGIPRECSGQVHEVNHDYCAY